MKTASSQSGNVLLYILIAIVLIGFLTIALRDNGGTNASVDNEKASSLATQIIKYGGELQSGVDTLLKNGVSESDLRFAYPNEFPDYGTITTTPQFQIFSQQGANVTYRSPPNNSTTIAKTYRILGNNAMPQAGSAKADLVMVLTDVTDGVCDAINKQVGISAKPSLTTCGTPTLYGINNLFKSSPDAIDPAAFTTLPALQFCAYCADQTRNIYFYTLLAR